MREIRMYYRNIVNYLHEKKRAFRFEWLAADSWIWIFTVVVVLFFYIPKLDLKWIPISFEIESLLEKVKERTTQSTTLIGLSFTIVGFIMANLAHKDNYIYKILFKKTLFFSTLYLGISLIASFIFFSSVCEKMPYNEVATTLLIGTILILIFLFMLGRMFRYLGIFISRHNISQVVKKEFSKELRRIENQNIAICSREYFELKEGTYTHFHSFMYIRNTIFNSIENENIDTLRDYLDIILYSYEYEQSYWSEENQKQCLWILNTDIIPEYIKHCIKESILKNTRSNLELLKDFVLRLEGLGIYRKKTRPIEPYYKESLELFSYYYSCYEKYRTDYKIKSEIEVMCKESPIDYVIGSYKHIYAIDNKEAIIKIYCKEVQDLFYTFIKFNNATIFEEGMQELIHQIGNRINDYCSITDIDKWINGQGEWSDRYWERLYIRNLFFRLKYWLYYLSYAEDQPVDKSLLKNYEESINKIFPTKCQKLWEFILMSVTQINSHCAWDYRYIKSGRIFTPIEDSDWLTQGFSHILVKNNEIQSINLNTQICFGQQSVLKDDWNIKYLTNITNEIKNKILIETYLQNKQDINSVIEDRFLQITSCLNDYMGNSLPVENEQNYVL